MSFLRSIIFTSVLVGLIAGTAISVVQAFGTAPLILQAEVFENAGAPAAVAPHDHAAGTPAAHSHDAPLAAGTSSPAHAHDEDGWSPADGFERTAYTAAANILTAIGYSFVLIGLFTLRGRPVSWREGLFWGLGAFVAVMLAPMLGLPPELPGTPAGPLFARQVWWIATVIATGSGLALLAFQKKPWAAVLAIALIAAPHMVGAPLAPAGEQALAPETLEHQFVIAAVLTSLVFWALIGTLSAGIFRRFEA
jgi:cobalt transporter subunit CbtA